MTLTTLLVVVTVGTVTGIAAGAARTLSASDRYEETYGGNFDATVEQVAGLPRTAELQALPSVTGVSSITFMFAAVLGHDGSPIETATFAGDQAAFGSQMVEGRTPRAVDEFAVSAGFIEQTHAALGDTFRLVTLTQEQGDTSGFDTPPDEIAGPTEEATLVGVFSGPGDLQELSAFALFPRSVLDLGDVGVSGSQHAVGLEPGADQAQLRSEIDELPDAAVFGIDRSELVLPDVRQAVSARGQATGVLAIVLGLASIAVLGQLLSRQFRLDDDEAAALRSAGMTSRELVIDPSVRAATPVVAGCIVAAPLAFLASGWFPLGFVELVEPQPGIRFEAAHLLVPAALAVGLVVWTALAMSVARRQRVVSRTPYVEALALRLPRAQTATGLRFAFSRARSGGSTIAPLVGLALVVATVVGAVTFGASMGRLIDEPGRSGNFDAAVGQGGDEIAPEVMDALLADPDVESVIPMSNAVVSLGSRSIDLTGYDVVRGSYEPVVIEGHAPTNADEAMMGQVTARDNGLDVGDRFEVTGPAGPVAFTVSGIGVITSIDGGDGVGSGGMIDVDGMRRIDPHATYGSAVIDLRGGTAAGSFALGSLDGSVALGALDPPAAIFNLQRVRDIPYVVGGLLAVLALLALGHQLVLSVRHRRHDLAVIRAIGGPGRWVAGVVHWQVTFWVVALVAIAVPAGVVVGRLVYGAFVERIGAQPGATVPILVIVVGAAGLVALANLVALSTTFGVRRRDVTEDLRGD